MKWLKDLWMPRKSTAPAPASRAEPERARWRSADDSGYPHAFALPRMGGAEIFDPALKHCPHAYRETDPIFENERDRARWHAARTDVLEHLMRVIADSEWKDRLVLRGSVLARAWLGSTARAPGDIDWVVLPPECSSFSTEARSMIDGIVRDVTSIGRVGEAVLDARFVAEDAIWAYSRADGIRLTFAWTVPDLPPGKLQSDFVFGERMPEPPSRMPVALSDGGRLVLSAASPELSLAWKILWLATDQYPQGKDLYDAVLLAEYVPPKREMIESVLIAAGESPAVLGSEMWSEIDWNDFVREYPWVEGDLNTWVLRMKAAMPWL